MASSRPSFEFENLKKEVNKTLQIAVGGQKWLIIQKEMVILENAIKNKNISEFDNSYKSIEKTSSPTTKSMSFYTKLFELKCVVDKRRGRGNPLGCISIGGVKALVGQQLSEGKRNQDEDSLLKESGNRRPPSGRKGRPEGGVIKKQQTGGQGRLEGSASSTTRSAKESSSSHHQFKKTDDRNAFTREQNSQQLANQVEYCSEEIKKLYIKLQNAWKELQIKDESLEKKSEEKDLKDKESSLRKGIADVNEQVDRIIQHLEMTRNTTGVKERAQEKQAQTVAEQDTKAKIGTLADWLDKLKRQVEECKYDVTFFQKLKNKDEKHEEMKKCRTCLVDICNKLKNKSVEENSEREYDQKRINEFAKQTELIKKIWVEEREKQGKEPSDSISTLSELRKHMSENRKALAEMKKDQENIKAEINLLKEDISRFDEESELSIEKTNKTQPEILQDIRNARKQLNDRRKQVAKEMRNRISILTDTLDRLKGQVDECRYDVTVFQELKTRDESHEEIKKYKTCLEDICNKLKNTSDKEKSIREENQTRLNEWKKQSELIKKIWVEECEGQGKEQPDSISTLTQLKKHISENRKALAVLKKDQETIKAEIKLLKEDISCFDDGTEPFTANTDTTQPEILQDIRNARKQLNDRKKARLKEMRKRSAGKKQENMELRKHVVSLWKVAFGTDRDLTNAEGADGRIQYELQILNIIVPELEKLEYISLDLMGVSNQIHQHVIGVPPNVKDTEKLNTTIDVLNCTLKILGSCHKETEVFDANFPKLFEAMSVESTNTNETFSGKCRLITEAAKSSADTVEQKYQKDINGLKEGHRVLEQEKQSLLTRLSKLAATNQTNNNPNIADLSDPHRPTKLADEYSDLYDNEWTTAFEEFENQGKPEKDILKLLLGIISEIFDVCGDIGRKQNSVIISGLLSPADIILTNVDDRSKTAKKSAHLSEKPKDELMKPNAEYLATVHSKTISELRKQTAESSVSSIIEYFKAQPQFSEWFKTNDVEVYTVRCIKLCWLMNVQDPPVYMERDLKAGSSFETAKYKPYTKAGKKIAFVVWPALFLHDGGALLAKGVAQGK